MNRRSIIMLRINVKLLNANLGRMIVLTDGELTPIN
jgi:hypothetical protein